MKRLIAAIIATVGMAGVAGATSTSYDQTLVNTVVATTTSYTIDASATNIDLLSAQITLSSHVVSAVTFTDGKPSTGTVTIVSPLALAVQAGSDTVTVSNNATLVPTAGSMTITVSSNGASALSNSTITVVGVLLKSGVQWTVGADSATTASSIASAINSYVPNLTASASLGVVSVSCVNTGSFCNSYRVTTTTSAISLSTAGLSNLFTGGTDNSVISLNGYLLKQGEAWSQQDVSSDTAISIMNAVNAIADYTASTNTTTSVLIKCAAAGKFCNSRTLSVTGTGLTALAANFAEGQENAILKINGVALIQGTDFTAGASSATAANAIAAAINANASLSSIITATAPLSCASLRCGVVVATGTVALTSNNYSWSSSTPAALSVSNSGLFGGTTGGFLLNGTTITIPNHGLFSGEDVVYTTGTVAISGLANGTTYFAIRVDANRLGLASSKANATAANPTYITLASTSTTGAHTYTLTPVALSGVLNVTWQASDDNVNWANMSASQINFSTPFSNSSTLFDFGAVNSKYFRASIAGPSTGGATVNITAKGKRYGFN